MPVEVFCCYARKDQALLKELKEHLIPFQRQELITIWADIDISAGEEWDKEIKKHLNSADIVLMLISASFLSSEYCWSVEMTQALERHKTGEALVIPIILRPCAWHVTPFARLEVLPERGRPVTNWRSNRHEPFNAIALDIGQIALELLAEKRGMGVKKKGNTGRITKRSDKIRSRRVVDEQFASDPSKIMVEVLSIIGYEDDKDVYAAEFIDLAEKQALLDCLEALPSDKQEAFKQQMSQATQEEDVKDIIKQYVSAEEYTEALKAASEDAFTRFIETLIPELDDDQLDQLERYLRTLSWSIAKLPPVQTPIATSSNVPDVPIEVQVLPAPIEQSPLTHTQPLIEQTLPEVSGVPLSGGFVYVEKGDDAGRVYKIDKTLLSIGRAETNDIILDDTKISRFHASLVDVGDGNYMLRDEGSHNGTILNGHRMTAHQLYTLRYGDRIQLGLTQLLIVIVTDGMNIFDEEAIHSLKDFPQEFKEVLQEPTGISYRLNANRILAEADARQDKLELLLAHESEFDVTELISFTPHQHVKIIQARVDKDLAQVRSKAGFIRVVTRFLLNYILAETTAGKIGSSNDLQDDDGEKAFLRTWYPLASILLKEDLSAPDQYWDSVLTVLREHHLDAAFQFLQDRATELYEEGEWLHLPMHESCKASLHRVYCSACKSGSWMDFWNIVHSSDTHLSIALRDGQLNRYSCAFCGYLPTKLKGIWHIPDYLESSFMYRVASFHDPKSASIYKMPDSLAIWQDEESLLAVLRLICKDMGSIADRDFPRQNAQSYFDVVHLVFSDDELQGRVGHILNKIKKHKRYDAYQLSEAQ